MSFARLVRSLWIALPLLLALAALSLAPQPAAPGASVAEGNAIALRPPPFVQPAYAQEGTDTATAADAAAAPLGFPQDEAGIAAYFKSASPVNLADVRSVYRVIEAQTADYIIGSVPLPGYAETEDVHVYVHKEGWFLAYYLKADPSGKIVDWRAYHDSGRTAINTKLENALGLAASFVAVPLTTISFYDFRYPNATHLMFVAEWAYAAEDSFEINLPNSYAYYERSWSFGTTDRGAMWLNGASLVDVNCNSFCTDQGTLTNAQLLPNQFHTVTVWGETGSGADYGYAALVIIHRVP